MGGEAHICECGEHAWADLRPVGTTMVDAADAAVLASKWWRLSSGKYAIGGAPPNRAFLHRLISAVPGGFADGVLVDHVDLNKLNNRRANLRQCSHSLNHGNAPLRSDNTSGFKGVSRDKKKWCASIMVNQRHLHIGNFNTPEEAAHAYNAAARRHFGEFARLNEVRMG